MILEVIWVSLLAGVGITAAFSCVVLGLARFREAPVAYGALAVVALAVFVAGVVLGVHIMLTTEVDM